MKNKTYSREITKDYLKKLGITYVSPDGNIIMRGDKVLNYYFDKTIKRPYFKINCYDPDLRQSVPKEERTNSTGQFQLGVHVVNYVWNKETKPAGFVIDHIDNDSTNNDINNLQMLSQKENVNKENTNWHTSEIKCDLNKPRSHYELKLEGYLLANEQAKKDKNSKASHLFRVNISRLRGNLRYYDKHIDEYKATHPKKTEHACHARAEKRRELQANVDSARKFYKQTLEAYGKNDPYVQKLWGEWKLAIAMLQDFKEQNKVRKIR